jgi:hypothetical protein
MAKKKGEDKPKAGAETKATFPNGAEVKVAPAGGDELKGTDDEAREAAATPASEPERCGNCKAYSLHDQTCHKYPPTVVSAAVTAFPEPPRREKDWCRQWEPVA